MFFLVKVVRDEGQYDRATRYIHLQYTLSSYPSPYIAFGTILDLIQSASGSLGHITTST